MEKEKTKFHQKWWFWVCIVLIICIIAIISNPEIVNTSTNIINTNMSNDTQQQNNNTETNNIENMQNASTIPKEKPTKNTFTLTYGTAGTYGVKEKLNNYEQIIYKVPIGKYSVVFNKSLSTAQIGTIFIEQNAIHKESTGEKVHNVDNTYYFNPSNGYKNVIEVKEGQHVFITINSSFTFTEI